MHVKSEREIHSNIHIYIHENIHTYYLLFSKKMNKKKYDFRLFSRCSMCTCRLFPSNLHSLDFLFQAYKMNIIYIFATGTECYTRYTIFNSNPAFLSFHDSSIEIDNHLLTHM